MNMIDMDSTTFYEVIFEKNDGGGTFRPHSAPFFLYLYTPSCSVCKMVKPLLEKLEKEFTNVKFVSSDASNIDEFCSSTDITTVPSLFMISTAGHPLMLTGIPTESSLRKVLTDFAV